MSKILMLKGLPASGKSTYAKELVARGGWKRVNKDDLRAMLDDGKWSKGNERFVVQVRNKIIDVALAEGNYSVVVDDTNFAPMHEHTLKAIADGYKIPFEVKLFDTPPEECIKRDLARHRSVGKDVIMDMYSQYLKPAPAVYTPPKNKPKAIIVDIDGTLAHMTKEGRLRFGRNAAFMWANVGEDIADQNIADIMYGAQNFGSKVILLSGRDSVCRPETEKWLDDNGITYDLLLMRPEGSNIKDSIVKRELFEYHIRDEFNVLYVLDDRDQVVDMWRNEIGLKVFQVAEGNF